MTETLRITATEKAQRLDRYLADVLPGYSRSQVQRLILAGAVTLNGEAVTNRTEVSVDDEIEVSFPPEEQESVAPPPPLDVRYEDEHLLVINKQAGLVVHDAAGYRGPTVVDALLAYHPEAIAADVDPSRPGIVHRLDRDTTGLMVLACTREAQEGLLAAFKARRVVKQYLALLCGGISPERGAIEAPIMRDPLQRQRMKVSPEGRPARTEYRVREYLGEYCLVEADLLTGRTHQIRVHFASINFPVAGDATYGFKRDRLGIGRQFLHAWHLAFEHPITGERIDLKSELPADLESVLLRLRRMK